MKRFCKRIYELFKTAFNLIVSLLSIFLFSSFACNKQIKKQREKREHKNCILMGNGPSLPALLNYYKDMEDKDYFAVNFMCLSDLFFQYKPSRYIILDPIYFKEDYIEKVQKTIDVLNETDWNMTLYIPHGYRNSKFARSITNDKIEIINYNHTPIDVTDKIDRFFFKRNLGMPWPENIIIAAIFEAINLGYEAIHLLGTEQSWLKLLRVDDNNNVTISLQHYTVTDVGKSEYLHTFLLSQARSFRSNVRLSVYAKSVGVDIINHTPESYLDAYRKDIPSI